MANNEKYTGFIKDEIIEKEYKKLSGIYTKLNTKTKKSINSLMNEAAFMSASLYELRQIINAKGYTEEYQNGANQKGVKKSSEIEIYNTMIKNYSAVMKQLTDLLPKEEPKVKIENDGFDDFIDSREDV